MNESRHKPKPAPYHTLVRDCGCRLRVRLPGDGRLIPCLWRGESAYCKVHPNGAGAWREVVGPNHVARIDVPGMRWRQEPAPKVVAPPPKPVAPLRPPVMPWFMVARGGGS